MRLVQVSENDPICESTGKITLHLEVIGLRDVEQVVPIGHLESVLIAVLVYKSDLAPARSKSSISRVSRADGG